MNKASLAPVWDMMRLRHGIGLRCIEALPADQIDAKPIQGMRSPKELAVHMYGFIQAAAESVLAGTISMDEKAELAKVKTKTDLVAYAKQCWQAGDAAFAKVTDAQLAAMVKAPWGDMPGFMMITTIPDEYLHHRGQLYAMLRQLGVEPPMNWDFEHNAPELQPRQHA
ncbi:MAG: DinB family protein [Candidatus Eisenbacteria bacterium]